jgi:signal peptidase I
MGQVLLGNRSGIAFSFAAGLALFMGSVASAVMGCTCGLLAGAVGFLLVGLVAGYRTLRVVRRPISRFSLALHAAATLSLPLASCALVRSTVLDFFYVPSESMVPTLEVGDYILVSRLGRTPRRGELVVFRGKGGILYVKRVAALAGDRVAVHHGELAVNGRNAPNLLDPDGEHPLDARYYTETGARRHRIVFLKPWLLRPSFSERTVPSGHLFVLGDNRDRSDDSRRFGFVSLHDVVGRPFSVGPSRAPDGELHWSRAGMLL